MMNLNNYLILAKEFILDKQFLNLFSSTIILFFASVLTWYICYKQLAKRDLFEIPKFEVRTRFMEILDRIIYFLKYLVLFPIYSFIWFLIFSFLLFLLSKSRPIEDILFLGIVLVAVTRMCAYVSHRLAEEMAQLLPLTLVVIFFLEPKAINLEIGTSSFFVLIQQIPRVAKYLLFIVVVEWFLRIWHWIVVFLNTEKQEKYEK